MADEPDSSDLEKTAKDSATSKDPLKDTERPETQAFIIPGSCYTTYVPTYNPKRDLSRR